MRLKKNFRTFIQFDSSLAQSSGAQMHLSAWNGKHSFVRRTELIQINSLRYRDVNTFVYCTITRNNYSILCFFLFVLNQSDDKKKQVCELRECAKLIRVWCREQAEENSNNNKTKATYFIEMWMNHNECTASETQEHEIVVNNILCYWNTPNNLMRITLYS